MANLQPCFKALPQLSVQYVIPRWGGDWEWVCEPCCTMCLCLCDFASAYSIANHNN